jgi:hypothetical protein
MTPQGKPPESVASNMGHTTEFQYILGEKTPPSHQYSHSISPHSSVQANKPPTTQFTKLPYNTLPITSPIPKFGMPTSMWNPTNTTNTTPNQILSFQQQHPNPINQNMWSIPNTTTHHQTQTQNPYQA